ncbi:glycosyltransferase [Striga asiatica]|uniref:Glycosyltransferase n=1 Tax=Striga asiatica TaxID=4170 RepID=A0A5A7P7P4_STRAF|nr:glycosyltransferase [Striga asiatica]
MALAKYFHLSKSRDRCFWLRKISFLTGSNRLVRTWSNPIQLAGPLRSTGCCGCLARCGSLRPRSRPGRGCWDGKARCRRSWRVLAHGRAWHDCWWDAAGDYGTLKECAWALAQDGHVGTSGHCARALGTSAGTRLIMLWSHAVSLGRAVFLGYAVSAAALGCTKECAAANLLRAGELSLDEIS